jgi:hypothetical protein
MPQGRMRLKLNEREITPTRKGGGTDETDRLRETNRFELRILKG